MLCLCIKDAPKFCMYVSGKMMDLLIVMFLKEISFDLLLLFFFFLYRLNIVIIFLSLSLPYLISFSVFVIFFFMADPWDHITPVLQKMCRNGQE